MGVGIGIGIGTGIGIGIGIGCGEKSAIFLGAERRPMGAGTWRLSDCGLV